MDKANRNRIKYSCRFLAWDGATIVDKINDSPKLLNGLFSLIRKSNERDKAAIARLTVLLDILQEHCVLTYIYIPADSSGKIEDRKELPCVDYLNFIDQKAQELKPKGHYSEEAQLIGTSRAIYDLIPGIIRDAIFKDDDQYVHIVTNEHTIPFELAYSESADKLFGYRNMIGRMQASYFPPPREAGSQPSILLIGDPASKGDHNYAELPGARQELLDLEQILHTRGFVVEKLQGDDLTRANLQSVIGKSYTIIHFATHGDEQQRTVQLSDGIFSYAEMSSLLMRGSLIFLNTNTSLALLHIISRNFFLLGSRALIGFSRGPIEDRSARLLASAQRQLVLGTGDNYSCATYPHP